MNNKDMAMNHVLLQNKPRQGDQDPDGGVLYDPEEIYFVTTFGCSWDIQYYNII